DALKAPSEVGYRLALRGRHLGCEHERTRFERQETEERARPAARDRLGSRRGHLFYVHAADRREHHHGSAAIAVERDAEVQLARDIGGALDVHLLDAQSLYLHAQDRPCRGLRFPRRFGDLDATRLSAPAGVHLSLHRDRRGDRLRRRFGLLRRHRDMAVRNGDARAREDLLRLEFVQLHGLPNIAPRTVSALPTPPTSVPPCVPPVREALATRLAREASSLR